VTAEQRSLLIFFVLSQLKPEACLGTAGATPDFLFIRLDQSFVLGVCPIVCAAVRHTIRHSDYSLLASGASSARTASHWSVDPRAHTEELYLGENLSGRGTIGRITDQMKLLLTK